jgi:hypothetical protein
VSLDLTALLAAQRAIKVARADYDFARDGGALYNTPINSEVIPSASILVGYVIYTSAAITSGGAAVLSFTLNGAVIAIADNTLGRITAALYTGVTASVTDAVRAIEGYISGAAITAGSATLWLFYLPTTG